MEHSRQVGLFKSTGLAKLSNSAVLVVSCGGHGSEIVRNLVLSGVGRVGILDSNVVSAADLENNCLVEKADVGVQTRAAAAVSHLRRYTRDESGVKEDGSTNALVWCAIEAEPTQTDICALALAKGYQAVVLTDSPLFHSETQQLSTSLRENGVAVVIVEAHGFCYAVATDFPPYRYQNITASPDYDRPYRVEHCESVGDGLWQLHIATIVDVQSGVNEHIPFQANQFVELFITNSQSTPGQDVIVLKIQKISGSVVSAALEAGNPQPALLQALLQTNAPDSTSSTFMRLSHQEVVFTPKELADTLEAAISNTAASSTPALLALKAKVLMTTKGISELEAVQETLDSLVCDEWDRPDPTDHSLQTAVASVRFNDAVSAVCSLAGSMAALEVLKFCAGRYKPMILTAFSDCRLIQASTSCHDNESTLQQLLGSQIHKQLENLRVLVVGSGAIGCEVLKGLAIMGVKHVQVADPDTVALSNLHRQFLFRREDVNSGLSKSQCACRTLNEQYGLAYQPHSLKIGRHSLNGSVEGLDEVDCIISAVDSQAIRFSLQLAAWANGIPMIDGGTKGLAGNVQAILPSITQPVGYERVDQKENFSCRDPGQITTMNHVISVSVAVFEWLFGTPDKCPRVVTDELAVDAQQLLHQIRLGKDALFAAQKLAHVLFVDSPTKLRDDPEKPLEYWRSNKFPAPVPDNHPHLSQFAERLVSQTEKCRLTALANTDPEELDEENSAFYVEFEKDDQGICDLVLSTSILLAHVYSTAVPTVFAVRYVGGRMQDAVLPTTCFVAAGMLMNMYMIATTDPQSSEARYERAYNFLCNGLSSLYQATSPARNTQLTAYLIPTSFSTLQHDIPQSLLNREQYPRPQFRTKAFNGDLTFIGDGTDPEARRLRTLEMFPGAKYVIFECYADADEVNPCCFLKINLSTST